MVEWPGLTSSAVRPLPDYFPLSSLGVREPYIGGDIHHLHATDSTGAHYFKWSNPSYDGGSQQGFLKVGADWSQQWQVTLPPSLFVDYNASVNAKGEVAIVGTINQTSNSGAAYTAKYGADGTLAWSAQFQYPLNGYTQGIVTSIAADGSVVSAGFLNGAANSYVIALTKYAADGTPLWTKGYCEEYADVPESIITDSAGNIYLSAANSVFAFSGDGTPLFSSTAALGTIYALSLSADESGLFGFYAPLPIGNKPVLTKFDSKTGAVDWTAHFATSAGIIELGDLLVSAEGLYMIGELPDTHQFCARFDEQGNQVWFEECAAFSHGVAVNGYIGSLVFFDSRGRTTDGGVPDAGVTVDGGGAGGGSMVILTAGLGAWRVGTDGTPLSF